MPLISKGSVLEQVEEETLVRELANPGSPGKWPLNCRQFELGIFRCHKQSVYKNVLPVHI